MSSDAFPARLQQFMSQYVNTYEKLEALLWFFNHRTQAIDATRLAHELGLQASALEDAMDGLASANLLTRIPDSRGLLKYEPADAQLDADVGLLAAFFEKDRFQVIRIMTENSIRRLRASTMKTFANCFLLGKPKQGG